MGVVTLLTDFGAGEYLAQVKGALLSVDASLTVVDVAHDLPPHAVAQGAYVLWAAAPRFPRTTVHMAVVDPGVGTARRGLVVDCARGVLVGPDNGLLMPAARALGVRAAYAIENERLLPERRSATFHGRDVFAPVAARLAGGLEPAEAGRLVHDAVPLELFDARLRAGGGAAAVEGRVLHVDRFGNVVTNVPRDLLARLDVGPAAARKDAPRLRVAVGSRSRDVPLLPAYGFAGEGEALATLGSADLLELAVREGNAADLLDAAPGAAVRVERA